MVPPGIAWTVTGYVLFSHKNVTYCLITFNVYVYYFILLYVICKIVADALDKGSSGQNVYKPRQVKSKQINQGKLNKIVISFKLVINKNKLIITDR